MWTLRNELNPSLLDLDICQILAKMCILVACDDGQMDPTFNHSGLVLMLIQKVMFFSSTRVLDIVVKLKEGIMLLALFVPFLMLRLLLASLVIDRMSDWSLRFCGDAATINYQQWSKNMTPV